MALPLLACISALGSAQDRRGQARDETVRARFLFHLAQFTFWPDRAGPAVRFCILDDSGLSGSLEKVVRARTIAGRRIEVVDATKQQELTECELAYLGKVRERDVRNFFASWNYPPVLLVGEGPRFTELGGMVSVALVPGREILEVNLANVHRAGLVLRSQLLRFARVVGPPPPSPPPPHRGPPPPPPGVRPPRRPRP